MLRRRVGRFATLAAPFDVNVVFYFPLLTIQVISKLVVKCLSAFSRKPGRLGLGGADVATRPYTREATRTTLVALKTPIATVTSRLVGHSVVRLRVATQLERRPSFAANAAPTLVADVLRPPIAVVVPCTSPRPLRDAGRRRRTPAEGLASEVRRRRPDTGTLATRPSIRLRAFPSPTRLGRTGRGVAVDMPY